MLRSTFSGFTTAQHALLANQRAIDVAGQNITNMNTVGYTRQTLDVVSLSPVASGYFGATYDNRVGQGVQMVGISQIRDPYLDIQYRNQLAKVGSADATDEILERLGNVFDETYNDGIRAALNDVISQLTTLSSTPNVATDSMDAVVRSSFEVLINQIHQKSYELEGLEEEIRQKLDDTLIPNVNSILNSIAELNVTIKNSQILGSPALELQDQRNMLLDELATYLPIEIKYSEDNTTSTVYEKLTVTFTDNEGVVHTLISDDQKAEFAVDTTTDDASLTITDALDPTGASSSKNVANSLVNGVLKGNLDMLNKSEVFDGSDIRGIGYYSGILDSFVNELATTLNDLNATTDASGVVTRNDLFEISGTGTTFTAENIKVSDAWMNGDVTLTTTHAEGAGGTDTSTAYENILQMIDSLINEEISLEIANPDGTATTVKVYQGTIQSMYDTLQSVQSIDRKASSSILENHVTVLNQIADSKDSISAVSQDEEVMDLMRYQQSYNAASRLMTVMDELLDKLINETGIVGR